MSVTYTPNFNLGKQTDHSDKFDMSVITDNMDKIDSALEQNKTQIAACRNDISDLQTSQSEQDSKVAEMESSKANTEDVYDKAAADSRFLAATGTAQKAEADATGANIAGSIAKMSEQISLTRSALGYQTKNLLIPVASSKAIKGITYTVNEDYSVTANGTATDTSTFVLEYVRNFSDTRKALIDERKVILSGCPSGGSSVHYRVQMYRSPSDTVIDYGFGIEFTFDTSSMVETANFAIIIFKNQTVDNLTFYPMLRYAEIEDDTYEPPKLTVDERLAVLEEKFAALEGSIT